MTCLADSRSGVDFTCVKRPAVLRLVDIFEPNLRDFSHSPPFRLGIANGSAVVAPFAGGVDRERWFVARARIVNLHPFEERRVEQNR